MSQTSDENVNNFMMITGNVDRETALRFLGLTSNVDEAVNLYFESGAEEGHGAHGFEEHHGAQHRGFEEEREDRTNGFASPSAAQLTDEEKKFIASQEKWVALERQYNEKFGGFGIMKIFARGVKGSGADFEAANPKFPLKIVPNHLADTLQFFPFLTKKRLLVVYAQKGPSGAEKNAQFDRALFSLGAVNALIEEKAAFTGVVDSTPAFDALRTFEVAKKDAPALLFFAYNRFNDLKMIAKISLEPLQAKRVQLTEVAGQIRAVFAGFERSEAENQIFETELERKKQTLRESAHRQFFGGFERDFGEPQPPNPANDKKLQMERKLKQDQEEAYQRMIQQKQEEDKKKHLEEQLLAAKEAEKLQKSNRRAELKKMFDSRTIDPSRVFEVCLRLPNGSKIFQNFDAKDKISVVADFVSVIEQKGFEEPDNEFELKSGFPPKGLDNSQTLEQAFPDGSGELITVTELFSSPSKH